MKLSPPLIATLFAFLAPAAASALTHSQTFDFTSSDFNSGFMSGGTFSNYGSDEISAALSPFDPVEGTLTGVTVNYAFTFTGGLAYGESTAGFYNATLRFFVNESGVPLGNFFDEGPVGAEGGFSTTFSGDIGSTGSAMISTGDMLVDEPVIRWRIDGDLQYGFSTDEIDSGGQISLTSGSIEVIYIYTPVAVPEPSTCAAIASLAVLAFAISRQRFRV